MGLDQSLLRRKRGRGKPVREEVAYWRKANHIHKWFLDNVVPEEKREDFNCDYAEVSKEKLEELKKVCELVVKKSKLVPGKVVESLRLTDKGLEPIKVRGKVILFKKTAKKNLPTMEGPFFGSTDYDEYYLVEVQRTIKLIDDIIENTDFDKYVIEYHCWW
jgi:cephalosporin-C deacetylase-like acetyl esterase